MGTIPKHAPFALFFLDGGAEKSKSRAKRGTGGAELTTCERAKGRRYIPPSPIPEGAREGKKIGYARAWLFFYKEREVTSVSKNIGKLTEEEKQEIVERYLEGGVTMQQIAYEYGVSKMTISRTIRNSRVLEDLEKTANIKSRLALLRLKTAATDATERLIDLLYENRDTDHQYLDMQIIQQILDRAGVRETKEDKQDVKVTFSTGGFSVNMPPGEENGNDTQ